MRSRELFSMLLRPSRIMSRCRLYMSVLSSRCLYCTRVTILAIDAFFLSVFGILEHHLKESRWFRPGSFRTIFGVGCFGLRR